jgi:hypothetical protein
MGAGTILLWFWVPGFWFRDSGFWFRVQGSAIENSSHTHGH